MAVRFKQQGQFLIVPKRGKPPIAPAGYEQFPGNPYKFWPSLEPCEHRVDEVRGEACCGTYNVLECKVIDAAVSRLDCRACRGNPNWIAGPDRHGDIFFKGHQGIGDNIYQRPSIKAACEKYKNVYVQTPWPQLYWDLPVKCVKIDSHLRTQRINVEKQSGWFYPPHGSTKKELNYNVRGFMENVSVLEQFNRIQEISEFELSMPVKDEWAFDVPNKFAVVHYPTLRKEWLNSARNCKVEYIQQCVDWLSDAGYTIISIAHIKNGQEWFVQEPSGCHVEYHHGELSIEQIAWLLSKSQIAISPVGFVLPLGWAVGCKTFIIYGGSTGPRILSDDRFPQTNLMNVLPEPFCECHRKEHSCNKEIEHLEKKLFSFLEGSSE